MGGVDLGILNKRKQPAFLLLNKALGIESADPEALNLLSESNHDEQAALPELPAYLLGVIKAHGNGRHGSTTTVAINGLLVHVRAFEDAYIVLLESFEVRDHAKRSVARFSLSHREEEVLTLVMKGMRAKDIGLELGISPTTVSDYFKSLLRKTESRNRSEMLAKTLDA